MTRTSWRRLKKRGIVRRTGGRCAYCGKRLGRKDATRDHVVPRSLGGKTSTSNLVLACTGCNQAKGNRTDVAPTFAE